MDPATQSSQISSSHGGVDGQNGAARESKLSGRKTSKGSPQTQIIHIPPATEPFVPMAAFYLAIYFYFFLSKTSSRCRSAAKPKEKEKRYFCSPFFIPNVTFSLFQWANDHIQKPSQSPRPAMLRICSQKTLHYCQSVTLIFYNVHADVNKTYRIVREPSEGVCAPVQTLISEPVSEIGLLKPQQA